MTRRLMVLALVAAASAAGAVRADPTQDMRALVRDYDADLAAQDPVGAGQRGDLAAAARWPDASPAADAREHQRRLAFQARLKAIAPTALAGEDALDHALLTWRVDIDLQGDRFDEARQPFTSDEGFYLAPVYAAEGLRLRNRDEAQAYLTRLRAVPAYFAVETANMRRGVATGFTAPRIIAARVAKAVEAQAQAPALEGELLAPFASLPEADRAAFTAQGEAAVRDAVKPALDALARFFTDEYLPHARTTLAASALPDGRAYYAYRVRRETTTSLTPDAIYALGRAEIARIRQAMDVEIAASGFKGDFKAFQAYLRTDPQFYVTSREALLEKASRLAKRVDGKLPQYFGRLPRLSYGVVPVPAAIEDGYTSGRYDEGSPQQGVSGSLLINTSHLTERPLYELPSLVAHEGAPGHHIQIALAQELEDVPQFRRESDITAFVEGWALYSERLVEEFGLYSTPYERFGELSMEMWRACRLVMDTGIHWKGWTRDEALACLKDNSALSETNIQNETDRYIAWPGQALGYKIGQLKLLELRRRAELRLGAKFDIRRFHDVVLDEGAMPLAVLEARVDAWIAAELTR